MIKKFPIYKGLQKPLIYKGFQGKYIAWGIGSLLIGLVSGGVIGTMVNMLFGGFACIAVIVAGLYLTSLQQKKGLHNKTKYVGVFQFGIDLNNKDFYEKQKKNRI